MSSKSRILIVLPLVFLVIVGCLAVQGKKVKLTPVPFTKEAGEPVVTATSRPASTPTIPTTGTLVVEFVYTGEWYRETFNYEPTAPNIRHIVLVIPENGDILPSSPGWVFSTLTFTPFPEPFAFREEAYGNEPFLENLYDAYAGLVDIALEPGKYKVAVAFIAAALPPPDGDAILYPGVTGGGASNEFHSVEVRPGEITHVIYELTDENGWGAVNILTMR